MKKLLAIVVLGLLWSGNAYAEIPEIKVKALECYFKKKAPRIHNRFIFFTENKKAIMKNYVRGNTYRNKEKLSVRYDYDEIHLSNAIYNLKINRASGKMSYIAYGLPQPAGDCKEYNDDLDLENSWRKMIDEVNKKKRDKIKF